MTDPMSCTSCGIVLAVASARGVCPACARFPGAPAGAPVRTADGAADSTPREPGPPPDPHATTGSGPTVPERGWPLAPPGYVIVNKIGRGGMGDVFLAHETLSNQFVAIKFLRDPGDPALLDRFALEFRALRAIVHPNAVRVLGHDFHRSDPFFVLELMEGGSLADALKDGPLAPARAVELIRKVALAVQALHDYRGHENPTAGILHRDIKPGNVLLTKDGEPKLADFGLAKFLDAKTVHTLNGMVGTLRYMPPEQINGKNGALGYPADVYGLGATLYHLLTGRAPFVADEFGDMLLAVLSALPVAPHEARAGLTRGLSAVVMKCLEKDPRDRYPTVAEFLAALDRWAESDKPPPVPFAARASKWLRRNRVALVACALLAAGGALGAAWPKPASAAPLEARQLEDLQAEFERNRDVPLVPERGLPQWHNWLVGPAPLGASPLQDGACSFQATGGLSMLELFRPTTESYRLTAQVQMVGGDLSNPQMGPPEVGAFLGHTLYPRATGPDGRGVVLFRFSDHDPQKAAGRAAVPQQFRFGWQCQIGDVGEPAGTHQTPFKVGTFWAADRFPAPWWTITLEVSPDLLVARWSRDGGEERELVRLTRAQRLRAFAAYKRQTDIAAQLATRPFDPGPRPTDWNPTGGLGIWCYRARVAVKNVTVSPLVPRGQNGND